MNPAAVVMVSVNKLELACNREPCNGVDTWRLHRSSHEQAMSNSEMQTPIADKARGFAPVVWLLGKLQSGKTSIIRELTQAADAEIGSGFRACTRTARVFDF